MSSILQIVVIAISLALDAVGVSVAEGLEAKDARLRQAFRVALTFGVFQALMPLGGWLVGNTLREFVDAIAPWIAFVLLVGIGILMLREALDDKKEEKRESLSLKTLILLGVATSIDAFVVGITLGLINIPLLLSILTIGVITFLLCLPAFLFGSQLNKYFNGKLDLIGGIALILLGLRILLTHIF